VCGPNCDFCCYTSPGGLFQGYCVPTANSWVLTLVQNGATVPSGAKRPNGTTDDGCQLDCQCNIVGATCNCATTPGSDCICHCNGQCLHDAICDVQITAPPNNGTCAPCPIGTGTNTECNGVGICNCGTCLCPTSIENAGGPACDEPTNGGQYSSCTECTLFLYHWCNLAGVYACMPLADCNTFGGIDTTCSESIPPGCENNCTCPNGQSHGTCVTIDGITQCDCDKKWHGGDCCTPGGLSTAAIAGIAGGVIAAIVIAGIVAFAVIGYGVKRGVDWVSLHNMNMNAAHDNPLHKPAMNEHVNAIHDPHGSGNGN